MEFQTIQKIRNMSNESLIPIERIKQKIYVVRGERVMLDTDLAKIYGVETKMFNRAVKRNLKRFPEDFMFQLSAEEDEGLRFQIGTSNKGRGGRRYLPFVFTEHGAPAGGEYFEQRQSRRSERAGRSRFRQAAANAHFKRGTGEKGRSARTQIRREFQNRVRRD